MGLLLNNTHLSPCLTCALFEAHTGGVFVNTYLLGVCEHLPVALSRVRLIRGTYRRGARMPPPIVYGARDAQYFHLFLYVIPPALSADSVADTCRN